MADSASSSPSPSSGFLILSTTDDTFYGTTFSAGPNSTAVLNNFGGWGDAYHSYYQFDISTGPSAVAVTQVLLSVYINPSVNDPVAQVRRVTSAWLGTTLTRTNLPTEDATNRGSIPTMAAGVARWVEVDITTLYQDWKSGASSNFGLKIHSTVTNNNNAGSIESKENTSARKPRLLITFGAGSSASSSPSSSLSPSPSRSISASISSSPSASVSSSPSPSVSPSSSPSPSHSISSSPSSSPSPSQSASSSTSASPSRSASSSPSPSSSISASLSSSPSSSPSPSHSISASPSRSISSSLSSSPSPSLSASSSISASPSSSISASPSPGSGISILINGIDRACPEIQFGSLAITDQINRTVDTAKFTVLQYTGQDFQPNVNDEVIVQDGLTKIYAGVIIQVDQSLEGHNLIVHRVTCKDYSHFMDRELVLERYTNTNLHDVVVDLIDRYADTYGFTDNNVGGVGVSIRSVSFSDIPLSDCFDKLAKLTGYLWYVDYDKDIHFFKKNEEVAPYNLDDTSGNFIWDSLNISNDFSQIRNRIKVTGGEGVAESRTELLTGDGEKDTFPLGNKFSELPVVEVDGVPVTVGVDFLQKDIDYDVMWSFNQKYLRFTAGNIPGAPLSGATNIEVTGTPLKPIVVQRSDNLSIANYGLYEFAVENNNITTRDEALQFGLAQLKSYADKIRNGNFQTYTSGLRSGQSITIFSTLMGISEQFVIQSVSYKMVTPDRGLWDVEFASAKTLSLIEVLQGLLLKEKVNQGEDETLLNFFDFTDDFFLVDTVGTVTATTTENYLWEQGVPGSDTYTNPIIWNKFTWA